MIGGKSGNNPGLNGQISECNEKQQGDEKSETLAMVPRDAVEHETTAYECNTISPRCIARNPGAQSDSKNK
jgi:hypothetical protein